MTDRPVAFDLQTYRETTWDVKVSDDLILHIRKPSEAVLIRMMDAQVEVEKNATTDPRAILPMVTEFLALAMSNNREGITIDENWFASHDIDLMVKVDMFRAYGSFVQEVMSDPNSESPRSQS